MYAVIETGGKQYRVGPGQTVEVELLPAEPGNEVAFDRVLLVSTGDETLVGTPTVPGARVIATVIREGRGPKIIVFRYKSKKRYRRTTGHRQDYIYLTVTDIQAHGQSLVADEERKRYERQAQRAANRFEAKLLAQLGDEIVAPEAAPIAPRATTAPARGARATTKTAGTLTADA
ncbi:MAG: 50S ribosomal protein L21 [Ktedonobacterales bacterium]|nr:50S ribosomal protein L21 [Ktedonobacterales bacterium]